MRLLKLIIVLCGLAALTGCLSLTAVNDFAKESSVITANKAMLDDTDAQTIANRYDRNVLSPDSDDFKNRLAVTGACLEVLNGYMTVLAQLSGGSVSNVSSEFSKIGEGLNALNVDPTYQAIVAAVGALTNVVLDAVVQRDLKKLIGDSKEPVDAILAYLVAQAETTRNTYVQAVAFNNKYWGDLFDTSRVDPIVKELGNRAHRADIASLKAKTAAADAAVVAFKKIRADNAALAANASRLDAKALIEQLKADEPYLMAAINALKAL